MIKLSELSTDEMLDKICDLTPHLSEIVTDKELTGLISKKAKQGASEAEVSTMAVEKITKAIPLLLKKHRDALLTILAIASERTLEEVKKQNIAVTIKELKELINDKELVDLFLSLTQ